MPKEIAPIARQRRRTHGRIQRAVRWGQRSRLPVSPHEGSPRPYEPSESTEPLGPDSTDTLAGVLGTTHVSCMQTQTKTELMGFMELQVGSLAVQVPIRAAEPVPTLPLASFEVEGETCAIFIRGDSSSKAVERAMGEAARQAVTHLSRKLLN
jgi:hypothetical protein